MIFNFPTNPNRALRDVPKFTMQARTEHPTFRKRESAAIGGPLVAPYILISASLTFPLT